jgi:hypothetical protein
VQKYKKLGRLWSLPLIFYNPQDHKKEDPGTEAGVTI